MEELLIKIKATTNFPFLSKNVVYRKELEMERQFVPVDMFTATTEKELSLRGDGKWVSWCSRIATNNITHRKKKKV